MPLRQPLRLKPCRPATGAAKPATARPARLWPPPDLAQPGCMEPEQVVTPEIVEKQRMELEKVLQDVEESSSKAKIAAKTAVDTAERCRQIEEETKNMIAEFIGKNAVAQS
ncbi:unnamed protein product [Prorocentrum cordatum]|uniref:V-type proton ATPase subunit G n=1 Tax=Prorocentrum cordatum TaxID=2364126 RepID=A0ABN9TMF2_9DINO|nr:unnamed protein product [Polarella glacialis]